MLILYIYIYQNIQTLASQLKDKQALAQSQVKSRKLNGLASKPPMSYGRQPGKKKTETVAQVLGINVIIYSATTIGSLCVSAHTPKCLECNNYNILTFLDLKIY